MLRLSVALILLAGNCMAQDFQSSNLPIVLIDTYGQTIMDEPDIVAGMQIIDNGEGQINSITDNPVYVGNINIEIRGSSSQDFDKNNYGLETIDLFGNDLDTNLMGFPKEEDWILHGPWADKSLLRNDLTMHIFREMGHYSSRTQFCELVIDEDYRGLYVFMEKIKRDDSRVDIAKLTPDDNEGDELTGGYILKFDWPEDPGFLSDYNAVAGGPLYFQYVDPKPQNITQQQEDYISSFIGEFEDALFASNYTNSQGQHYSEYIDIYTFIDQLIINELAKDVDGYKLSTFMHKDKDSKDPRLKAGPVWDYNIAWYNADYCYGWDSTGWLFSELYCEDLELMPQWWTKFWADDYFLDALACRWAELKTTIINEEYLNGYIIAQESLIGDAADRNYERWDILNEETWGHPFDPPGSWNGEVQILKDWVSARLTWMDNNIPGNCAATSIEENSVEFSMGPNPTSGQLNIRSTDQLDIEIWNIQGQLVRTFASVYPNSQLILGEMADGVYTLVLDNGAARRQEKLVIQH